MHQHKCPICENNMNYFARYPKAVCGDCVELTTDKTGNKVKFYNSDMLGSGFYSVHDIENKKIKKEDHECYINNIKCYAEEGRFGGIIIQLV